MFDIFGDSDRRRRFALDDTDVLLLEMLCDDGRLSNRALAKEAGVTEATVAARLRALMDQRILHVGALLDWRAAGYGWTSYVLVSVEGRPLDEVGRAVAGIDGVVEVLVVFGKSDLVTRVILPDDQSVAPLRDRLSAVPGVRSLEFSVINTIKKYTTRFSSRSAGTGIVSPLGFPAAADLDPLDRSIIDELLVDGRRSNREIARRLEVSEATVRARLGRLERGGLLRIRGQVDADRAGAVAAWALVLISTAGGSSETVATQLGGLPEVAAVAMTTGPHDIIAFLTASSRARLVHVVMNEIRALHGVRSTETNEVIRTISLHCHWVRFIS